MENNTLSWKQYLPLLTKKGRRQAGQFLVEGSRICQDALNASREIEAAFLSETFSSDNRWPTFRAMLDERNIPWRILPERHFQKISDTPSPQGIALVLTLPAPQDIVKQLEDCNFILALQSVRDPGNLGTLIRTADWYGVQGILLSEDCVDPFNSKVVRSTMGSLFHLPVYQDVNFQELLPQLQKEGFRIVTTALKNGKGLPALQIRQPAIILLGSEAHGLSDDLLSQSDDVITIPGFGQAESLNVAIAGGVIMHYIAEQIYPANETDGYEPG